MSFKLEGQCTQFKFSYFSALAVLLENRSNIVDTSRSCASIYIVSSYDRVTTMKTQIKKWGNSAVVRIPKPLLQGVDLEIESQVDLSIVNGRLVIEPISDEEFTLDALLAGTTPDNVHDEVDFGEPVGNEVA